MSKKKNKGNKVASLQKTTSTITTSSARTTTKMTEELLFGRRNFMFLLAGCGLIALGFFLMSGGSMPDSQTWDETLIYSKRRTLLAPIVILAGLSLQVYTIFAKKD